MTVSKTSARKVSGPFTVMALAAAGLTLAACAETNEAIENSHLLRHGNWEQLYGTHRNRVETVTIRHAVSFAADRAGLDGLQRRRLVEFLQSSNIGGVDQVSLVAATGDAGQQPLAAARMEYLKGELDAFGIAAAEDAAEGDPTGDQVTIVVERTIVITPDCSQPQPVPGQRPSLVSGCSDTANLGMMIADPRDLVFGRPVGPADGEKAAKGVETYRLGEIEELEESSTSTTGDKL